MAISQPVGLNIIGESFQLTLYEVRITKLFVRFGEVLTESNMCEALKHQSMCCNETSTPKYL